MFNFEYLNRLSAGLHLIDETLHISWCHELVHKFVKSTINLIKTLVMHGA